ncbi:cysteinyl-tRNA synthetase [Tulasnella sp. 418]|nr:cysteinyl-tRNA synthetase [Tulasnella sp. 418]
MGTLKYLNISNNKFETIPKVLCEMRHLVDLDVSFNMISEFPAEMGHLIDLETLVIVGNKITSFPEEVKGMVKLKELDCRRNLITDLSPVFHCPKLELLRAENNLLHGVELIQNTQLRKMCVQGNERLISFAVRVPEADTAVTPSPYHLTIVDLTKCMLSSLDDVALSQLQSLTSLKFDHNIVRTIPDAVCHLPELSHLSGSNNQLDALPEAIGHLKNLKTLLVHNNNIKVVPQSIWQCSSLEEFNCSSNLLTIWNEMGKETTLLDGGSGSSVPPLALSLERLYLADNRLTDDIFGSLNSMKVLKVLNLSFNDLYSLPPLKWSMFTQLRELYLSGNKLATLPGEDLNQLHHLKVLFLNANRLQTLPAELTKVPTLESLDVGNNNLKYNIANWQFDWNWNFNHALQYLNLSGNKRLEIKSDAAHRGGRSYLTDFSELGHLRMLGLMDVTLSVNPSIPDESEDRRVRTSPSDINGMAYGIADNLGKVEQLSVFDLVAPNFRGNTNECLFGMFGRVMPHQTSNKLTKYLHDHFLTTFGEELDALRPERADDIEDAMRRAFLTLNKQAYKWLTPSGQRKMSAVAASAASASDLKNAASALVVYIVVDPKEAKKTMYVANIGNILAVVSRRQSNPIQVSTHHDPFDRDETTRIRTAEGWVSPKGAVNDELEVSRAFGMYHLLPAVNARPSIETITLTDQDEFIIIGNRGLWDYVSPQTAIDIARQSRQDPMLAAQRLRDHAMSHGADGSTMIMVVSIGDLFSQRIRQQTADALDEFSSKRVGPSRAGQFVNDRTLARLEKEVDPPTGHLALVFTDIRNSTSLWEKNAGMPTAMRLHNQLLRRQLREVGGYEVKTEGDAFMVSFPSVPHALLWCLTVQVQLLHEEWPQWILNDPDGGAIYVEDSLVARGLSVRMGIHWGAPNCEPDPVTGRMDYFGTMVNRSSRISASAKGGQIMVSSDVMREIVKYITLVETDEAGILTSDDTPAAEGTIPSDLFQTIEGIKRLGLIVKEVGESKLKGLEVPEMLSLVYPMDLMGRLRYLADEDSGGSLNARRVQFSVDQVRQLAMLAIRIEALASGRVFQHSSTLTRNASIVSAATVTGIEGDMSSEMVDHSKRLYANPEVLMPAIKDNATDADLLMLMESLSMRVENAISTLYLKHVGGYHDVLAALEQATRVNPSMLVQALSMFGKLMEQ